jgi:hypothetical protein
MKPSVLFFFSIAFTLLTFFHGDLSASTSSSNYSDGSLTCTDLPDLARTETEDNPCYLPEWYNTYNITQNSCTFQWDDAYGASYYTVQWRYQGGTWYNLGGYCYQTWINIYDLEPCNAYEWRVKSHCSYGYSSPWCYPVYFNTDCNVCPKPYSTYTSNITEHSAKLHWSEVWGAQDYVVQIRWPSGSWTTIPGSPCQSNWLTVYNLEPGTSYDWRVKAKCSYNSYSDWAYGWFETSHSYYCYYPEWLHCYDITDYSAVWKWAPVYNADYYHIQWRIPGGPWYDLSGGWCYG